MWCRWCRSGIDLLTRIVHVRRFDFFSWRRRGRGPLKRNGLQLLNVYHRRTVNCREHIVVGHPLSLQIISPSIFIQYLHCRELNCCWLDRKMLNRRCRRSCIAVQVRFSNSQFLDCNYLV